MDWQANWTESDAGLPDPKDEVLVETDIWMYICQIVLKPRKAQRMPPPYWLVTGSGLPIRIPGTRWIPMPPYRQPKQDEPAK